MVKSKTTYDSFEKFYGDLLIVFTSHARTRSNEINKSELFITDRIKAGNFYLVDDTVHVVNGDYLIIGKEIKDHPEYDWKDVFLVVTIINSKLRKLNNIDKN